MMMKKKHVTECAKLLQEYEEGKQRNLESEHEANEEVVKVRKGDGHIMVQEVSYPSEPEKMLKDYTEAATEELSRKKMELSEVREKNEMIETQRNRMKSEEAQEDVEKIKKKKNKKNDDLRKHTEKATGGRRGVF